MPQMGGAYIGAGVVVPRLGVGKGPIYGCRRIHGMGPI